MWVALIKERMHMRVCLCMVWDLNILRATDSDAYEFPSTQKCSLFMLLSCDRGGERAASTNGVPIKQLWLCTPEVAHASSPSTAPRRTRTGASCIAELSRWRLRNCWEQLIVLRSMVFLPLQRWTDMDWSRGRSRGKPIGRLLGRPLGLPLGTQCCWTWQQLHDVGPEQPMKQQDDIVLLPLQISLGLIHLSWWCIGVWIVVKKRVVSNVEYPCKAWQ